MAQVKTRKQKISSGKSKYINVYHHVKDVCKKAIRNPNTIRKDENSIKHALNVCKGTAYLTKLEKYISEAENKWKTKNPPVQWMKEKAAADKAMRTPSRQFELIRKQKKYK